MRVYTGFVCLFFAVLLAAGQTASQGDLTPVRPGTFVQEVGQAYTTADGLPSDGVNAVVVAEDGTVYAGTDGGLARFDGTRWALEWNEANGKIRCITTDGDQIAVATDSELYVRDGDGPWETKATLAHPPISIEFQEHSVFIVHADGTNHATEGWGGLTIQGKLIQFSGIRQVGSRSVEDQTHEWVVATETGFYRRVSGPWERVLPESGDRSWAPTDVRAVLFAANGDLWFASPQGVGRRTGDTWALFEGKDGLPYNDFTCMAEGPEGEIWFGTTKGAIRFDGARFAYREGRRWLPDNHVRGIAVSPNGDAWFATAKGVGRIERRAMTLAEKAAFYEEEIDRYNRRTPFGYVMSAPLGAPGDKSTATRRDDDNDGQWTGEYGAAQCFAYAATKDPKAKERATLAFEGLRFFSQVTQGGSHPAPKGFPARTIWPTDSPRNPNEEESYSIAHQEKERESDRLWKVIYPRWPTSADGQWYWKCDTSSDELDGHYFLNGLYYDLVAESDEEKARVAEVVRDMTDHLIEHNFRLVDHDGAPTRWANFSPDSLNFDSNWWPERGLNSLSMLSFLRVAAHVTGDAKYGAVADQLITEHGYAMNIMYPKYQKGPGSFVQFDDEMAFMNYYNVMKYETNPKVREMVALSWWDYWELEAYELNPFFNFAYAAGCTGATFTSPWGTRDLTPGQEALEEAVETLKRYPMNLIDWRQTNSHRLDVLPLPDHAREGDGARGKGYHVSGKVLPIDERFVQYWSTDAWSLDSGGEGRNLATGMPFLLGYYMGLYHGFIVE
ncbi:MAG: hypothetical protein KF886_15605 [Candidatus Hydrogenedentes bacterium]|nr:hypothetical protein [Candidatus Hydrogenedentota bacterium]